MSSVSDMDQVIIGIGCVLLLGFIFAGLAVLCDEWLVPWLEVIQKRTGMSDDLAGVTLVAFGSAAPELMISLASVCSGDENVGLGVVCGSAMIAFGLIPPACYFAVRKSLKLAAWPIVRDALFYLIALAFVLWAIVNGSGTVSPWQCYVLFGYYICYICVVFATRHLSESTAETSSGEKTGLLETGDTAEPASGQASDDAGTAGSAATTVSEVKSNDTPRTVMRKVSLHMSRSSSFQCCDEEDPNASVVSSLEDISDDGESETGCLGSIYNFVAETIYGNLFAITIPNPPDVEGGEVANLPDAEVPSLSKTILGTFMAFVWLAGLSEAAYYTVVLVCTYVTGFNELTVGAVLLAFGSQIPDAIASISLAKSGHLDGAISSCISSQVIVVTVGLGLPWSVASLAGRSINLGSSSADNTMDEILVGIVFVTAMVYLLTTINSVPRTGEAEITRTGATLILVFFAIGYTTFLVLEILSEMKIALYDDDDSS